MRVFCLIALLHLVVSVAAGADTLAVVEHGYLGANGTILAPPICFVVDDSTVTVSGVDYFSGAERNLLLDAKPKVPQMTRRTDPQVETLNAMETEFHAARERGESIAQAAARAIARIRSDDTVDSASIVVSGTQLSFRWENTSNLVMSFDFANLDPVDVPEVSWRTGMERIMGITVDCLEDGCLVLRGYRYQHIVPQANVGAVLAMVFDARNGMTPDLRVKLVNKTCGGFVADFEKRSVE